MAIALVTHVVKTGTSTNGATSGSIDTTGANLLVFPVCYAFGSSLVVSDSKSNTWTGLTVRSYTTRTSVRIYYAKNPTVGTSHTFTTAGTNCFANPMALSFSGCDTTSPFDVENGGSAQATSQATGSVTPNQNNSLIIALTDGEDSTLASVTIDSGFTIGDIVPNAITTAGANAYLLQGTAAAVNPTWTYTALERAAVAIAVFKPAAAGGSPLRRNSEMNGLGASGPFFHNPLG